MKLCGFLGVILIGSCATSTSKLSVSLKRSEGKIESSFLIKLLIHTRNSPTIQDLSALSQAGESDKGWGHSGGH